jgi:carbon-monoxide dehydrogenase small subunit
MDNIVVNVTVNGQSYRLETRQNQTLLYLLREELGLTGTKDGCSEGECGACTVLMDGEPVNSCLVLAGQADDRNVLTIEGLAQNGELHPVQRSFVETAAVQCGFCTPGLIMASVALIDHTPDPTPDDIRVALSGNLCRCTGYTKIVEAVQRAAAEVKRG